MPNAIARRLVETLAAALLLVVQPASANVAPSITGTPVKYVVQGTPFSFQPNAGDADGNTLRFTIVNKPAWASFSSSSGRLSGTPASAHIGSYEGVQITVSDGKLTTSLAPFKLVVTASNSAPGISGSPTPSVSPGTYFSFRPTYWDPNGDALTFTIANKPAWASFSASNGKLYGTPTSAHAGSYAGIKISVSDGKATGSMTFSLTVGGGTASGGGTSTGGSTGGGTPTPTSTTMTVSWQPPTTHTDGSPLTSLAGYRIYYRLSNETAERHVQISNAGLTSYVIQNLPKGTYVVAMTSLSAAGVESPRTAIANKTI